jgi:rhodanese-related sulfurtransferase
MRTAATVLSLVAATGALGAQYATPEPGDVKRITVAELKKLHDAGAVLVLDVRSAEAYREGHIPGAISMPLAAIADRAGELKGAKKRIVAYCT